MFDQRQIGRREILQTVGGTSASLLMGAATGKLSFATAAQKRPKIAAAITEFTFRSHAHVILENFLEPYYFNGQLTDPGVDVVSFYIDQFPGDRDMAKDVAAQYGIKIYPTIEGALCQGGSTLAVDGVLSIAEHGNYPVNEKGQRQYPRKRFFDEITAVMKRSGRSVPLFNDKHLSYRTDWSQEMYDTTQQLKIPFMAGGSVPLAQRRRHWSCPMVSKSKKQSQYMADRSKLTTFTAWNYYNPLSNHAAGVKRESHKYSSSQARMSGKRPTRDFGRRIWQKPAWMLNSDPKDRPCANSLSRGAKILFPRTRSCSPIGMASAQSFCASEVMISAGTSAAA